MVVETAKDSLILNQIIEQKRDTFMVEEDCIVPDVKPDILNIISNSGIVCIYKKEIMDGKIIPCFSARVLGALTRKNGRPIVNVRKLVTYDWVLFPSHREAMAKINQPLMESVNAVSQYIGAKIIYLKELAQMAANNSKETEWLCESFGLGIDDVVGLTSTGNSVVVTEGSNVYIQPISDKRIREKTKSELRDWLNK